MEKRESLDVLKAGEIRQPKGSQSAIFCALGSVHLSFLSRTS